MTTPYPLNWGAARARARGPVVTSPAPDRNAIGVHAGGYAVYGGLSVATGALAAEHHADYTDTQPMVQIGPFPQWSDPGRIVTFDPFGHRVVQDFGAEIAAGLNLRPTIAVTTGQLAIPEIATALFRRDLQADGRILSRQGDISVTKISIDPVWHLPGIARRLGLDEGVMRQALVDQSGGMYPDLVARPDLPLFLPPIGGTSVYLFGDPARLGQARTQVTCRMHDECNGSDVFGSDLCTCRPYLIHGIEECIRGAQQGGVGIIVYNRKEGRALGEVVKYLVYNARKRASGGDLPGEYFTHTHQVAGVDDMRLQELSTDVLHWLGVTRVAHWVSMSNLKRDAVLQSGIAIDRQVEIPHDRIAPNARVEISAKIGAGYEGTFGRTG
ncbi:GTP cyclohydrolase II [Loktanella sp. M215]|uniref:GTP cyclohydrolase II n=1 Tax=Loktanella sp. M215 TaxID=2675431 RepID=UPI001F012575|nr:GTP cyclohydrolase II [Loktanella sp. M215]